MACYVLKIRHFFIVHIGCDLYNTCVVALLFPFDEVVSVVDDGCDLVYAKLRGVLLVPIPAEERSIIGWF